MNFFGWVLIAIASLNICVNIVIVGIGIASNIWLFAKSYYN